MAGGAIGQVFMKPHIWNIYKVTDKTLADKANALLSSLL